MLNNHYVPGTILWTLAINLMYESYWPETTIHLVPAEAMLHTQPVHRVCVCVCVCVWKLCSHAASSLCVYVCVCVCRSYAHMQPVHCVCAEAMLTCRQFTVCVEATLTPSQFTVCVYTPDSMLCAEKTEWKDVVPALGSSWFRSKFGNNPNSYIRRGTHKELWDKGREG